MIQNVRGHGNCRFYVTVEDLLNCLIPVSTNVKTFRKEAHDFIDNNRDKVLPSFSFRGKILEWKVAA